MSYSKFCVIRLHIIKGELDHVEKALYPEEPQVSDEDEKKGIPTSAKVFFGATSPLWVPVGVAGFIIGIPVLGAIAVQHKVSQRRKLNSYRDHPRDYLERRSKKFLAVLTEYDVLKYAERQMENTSRVLSKYISAIPTLIEADKRIVHQLLNETRNYDELSDQYTPVIEKCVDLRKNIMPAIGIELCPATVDECDLQWKKDGTSCLGEGKFAVVFRGQLKNGGIDRTLDPNLCFNVAVKVFKQPLDELNSRLYLYEEETIRYVFVQILPSYGFRKLLRRHIRSKRKHNIYLFNTEKCEILLELDSRNKYMQRPPLPLCRYNRLKHLFDSHFTAGELQMNI